MGVDAALARELRQLRLAAGLTQEELAERAGISVRAVSDAERGVRGHLYPATAKRLTDALGLDDRAAQRFVALAKGVGRRGTRSAPMPSPWTPLIGRDEILTVLKERISDPSTRLTTLTGPGGVGKTRLAIAAAEGAAAAFDDGVAFVQLANCRDADAAGLAIATAVGGNAAHGTIVDMVCAAIGYRRILLVCDTFEGVPDAASLVAEILARCPRAAALVTSRIPLRILAEQVLRVEPLDARAARELFVNRAAQARPGIDFAESAELIDAICARLQGVPLAIELAAARVAHLGLSDLDTRLSRQLDILVGGSVDGDARHRTIEATVAWSFDLLDAQTRAALAHLSVFEGWVLASAEAVLARDPLPDVSRLVEQSLVSPPSPTDPHGRYRLLDVVREFAGARLQQRGEDRIARARHAHWFLQAAEVEAAAIRHTGQQRAHREMSADLGNLRLAFRWESETGGSAEALRLAAALWMFWPWEGGFSEGRAWLRTSLAAAADDIDPNLVARAHWGAGMLAYLQGDYAEARIHASALRHSAEGGGPLEGRNALTVRGMVALADRRVAEATALFQDALAVARELPDDPWLLSISTLNDGLGPTHSGGLDHAAARFALARGMFAELGDETYHARAIRHLAAVRLLAGDGEAARRLLDESSAIAAGAVDRWGLAETIEGAAHVAAATGDARRAGLLAARASGLRRSLGVALHPFDAMLADRHLTPLRGAEAFEAGWREGLLVDEPVWGI